MDTYRDPQTLEYALEPCSTPVVFVMGLHRSGTTLIYSALADAMNCTGLSLHDVIFYDGLLMQHEAGARDKAAAAIDNYFTKANYLSRGNDNIPLNSKTLEEYGWVLKRHGGSFSTTQTSVSVLQELTRKLTKIKAPQHCLMLKNPWDTGRTMILARYFPNAKFIFVKRNAIEILHSEVNNALLFTKRQDPLLKLLAKDIRLTRWSNRLAKTLRITLGTQGFIKLVTKLMIADIASNLEKYEKDRRDLCKTRQMEISYSEFVDYPSEVLRKAGQFLNLPLQESVIANMQTPKRSTKPLHPAVEAKAHTLQARLRAQALERFLDESDNK